MTAKSFKRLELMRYGVQRGSELAQPHWDRHALWGFAALRGRLSMLCGEGRVSLASQLVVQAQASEGACAWLVCAGFEPFAPDLAATGVALESLVVVRLSDASKLARAGDLLARSGGVDLLVVDVQSAPQPGILKRLADHAHKHAIAVVVLTHDVVCEVASLVVEVCPEGPNTLSLKALRDRANPGLWQRSECFDAAPGSP